MLRTKRIAGYYKEALAEKYPGEKELLHLAAGNFDQLYQFLEREKDHDRKRLLHGLSEKDYKDAKAEVLEEHLQYASKYRAEWERKGELELYEKYILCPRIFFEEMTCYRKWIQDYFSDKEKEQFKKNPGAIWDYIKAKITYDEGQDYSTIFSTPVATLKLRFGNPVSQRILCAAICRTLGIPARMNQVTQEVEAYIDGKFIRISEHITRMFHMQPEEKQKPEETVALILKRKKGEEWNYGQNWTIGKFCQDCFVTLDYQGVEFEGMELKLKLEPGCYRILTANRLPSGDQLASECRILLNSEKDTIVAYGDQLASECRIPLEQRQPLELELRMRMSHPEELLVSHQLEDFEIIEDGEKKRISTWMEHGLYILAFLEPGEEPTEHVLNEIAMHQESFRKLGVGICFIIRNQEVQKTAAWEKAIQALPKIKIVRGSLDELAEPLARNMYVDPGKLPLLIITNPGLQGIYACSGYHAGSINLILELLSLLFTPLQNQMPAKND